MLCVVACFADECFSYGFAFDHLFDVVATNAHRVFGVVSCKFCLFEEVQASQALNLVAPH